MRTFAYTLAAIALGLVAGALVGWAKLSNRGAPPPPAAPLPGVEVAAANAAPPAPLSDPTTATSGSAAAGTLAAASERPGAPNATDPPLNDPAAPVTAVLVVPHGPGFFAELDLAAASLQTLPVYAGTLARDGPVVPTAVARAAKIGTLRGPVAKVELLHLGFLREAQPVAAHVRTAEGVEGMVLLRVARKGQPDTTVALRPLAAPDAALPGAAPPQP